MQITITIPKLITIRAHWKWGLLAAFMLAFTLTWSSPVGTPSAEAGASKTEINFSADQKSSGPPPFGCYSVQDQNQVELFQVCDNNAQAGFPQSVPGLCDSDLTAACEDSNPTKGEIRVSVIFDDYIVAESKPPPNYKPTNTAGQPCTGAVICFLNPFQNTAQTLAWFPEDVDGNGQVALGDILRLLAIFGQPKPQ